MRPAIVTALADWQNLPPTSLTWGLLHTDPAPEAFLFNAESEGCGLIDWDTGSFGPLIYDLASAVMYVGGQESGGALVNAYLDQGVLDRSEMDKSLEPMLRLRWAVQADYFARRVTTNDMTGIAGSDGNEQGLEDARLHLTR